tara:strand:- start:674 stop:817 length:144 start_codon:yes stop_codon:yes gene_type:complete
MNVEYSKGPLEEVNDFLDVVKEMEGIKGQTFTIDYAISVMKRIKEQL